LTGGISFFAIATSDVYGGNIQIAADRIDIGKDTLVSSRHAYFGLIPEANIDAAVSTSQLMYDLD
jgi:hypothetical protein